VCVTTVCAFRRLTHLARNTQLQSKERESDVQLELLQSATCYQRTATQQQHSLTQHSNSNMHGLSLLCAALLVAQVQGFLPHSHSHSHSHFHSSAPASASAKGHGHGPSQGRGLGHTRSTQTQTSRQRHRQSSLHMSAALPTLVSAVSVAGNTYTYCII
jgi:hypothetical protein